eukprot:403374361
MKTAYERFIEANDKLFKCYESVNHEQWKSLSQAEQGLLCHTEKEQVQQFLTNNSLGFANLLKDRIDSINSAAPHQH